MHKIVGQNKLLKSAKKNFIPIVSDPIGLKASKEEKS